MSALKAVRIRLGTDFHSPLIDEKVRLPLTAGGKHWRTTEPRVVSVNTTQPPILVNKVEAYYVYDKGGQQVGVIDLDPLASQADKVEAVTGGLNLLTVQLAAKGLI